MLLEFAAARGLFPRVERRARPFEVRGRACAALTWTFRLASEIAGVSGSGKSSLAWRAVCGRLAAIPGRCRRTRRRMGAAAHTDVSDVRYVPAALALHQRPSVPSGCAAFGTMPKLLNSLRLLFSRVGSHACPHCGTYAAFRQPLPPSNPSVASCDQRFGPGAEDLAFNSGGACPTCSSTTRHRAHYGQRGRAGARRNKTINEDAVLPWGSLMWGPHETGVRRNGR